MATTGREKKKKKESCVSIRTLQSVKLKNKNRLSGGERGRREHSFVTVPWITKTQLREAAAIHRPFVHRVSKKKKKERSAKFTFKFKWNIQHLPRRVNIYHKSRENNFQYPQLMYQTQSIQKKILLFLPPHLSFSKQKKKKRILLEEPLRRFQGFNIRGLNQIHPDAKLIFFHLPPFHLPFPSNSSPLLSTPPLFRSATLPIRGASLCRRRQR